MKHWMTRHVFRRRGPVTGLRDPEKICADPFDQNPPTRARLIRRRNLRGHSLRPTGCTLERLARWQRHLLAEDVHESASDSTQVFSRILTEGKINDRCDVVSLEEADAAWIREPLLQRRQLVHPFPNIGSEGVQDQH